ncbi:MAG: ATP-binding protein, partial [Chloroflexota bacterium]|nr:ATP-binding protein [Chloroflexota bacterium]
GESRAQELLAELTDLLKGDAGDAPSRLGVPDSHIPEDVRWARAATATLDAGGEGDVRQARGLLGSLAEIGTLFPDQLAALATPDQTEALQDILDSERFHEQLPDLRGAMRTIREGVRAIYTDEWRCYRDALHAALTSLEARADWVLLSDADQAEIAARLVLTLPETPDDENLLAAYRTLLVRFRSLPALQTDLEAEVARRAPASTPLPEREAIEEIATRRLDEQETELAQARKLTYLGIMASAMAHGLNQPIGVIRAITSASISDFQGGLLTLEETPSKFTKILAQTDRLAKIIDNMRAFARGDWRPRERVDLGQVVEQMCDMFADQFENRHINLQCSVEHIESTLMVRANPVQLQEVLINLLSNARDAIEGQPNASVHVRCWRVDDGNCAFSVQDNGPGLSPDYREQIFIPFVTTKPSEKGTGLGLFTSHRVIAELGGQLTYEDRPGGGARFVVRLPSLQPDEG